MIEARNSSGRQWNRDGVLDALARHCGVGADDLLRAIDRENVAFAEGDPARVNGDSVTFEPGARTAWHTHSLGQTLIVVSGCGWVQQEGRAVEEIRPGDVVWFTPGVRHWHGATATTAMTQIAIQEKLDGKAVEWMEKVTDQQYRRYLRNGTCGGGR